MPANRRWDLIRALKG